MTVFHDSIYDRPLIDSIVLIANSFERIANSVEKISDNYADLVELSKKILSGNVPELLKKILEGEQKD